MANVPTLFTHRQTLQFINAENYIQAVSKMSTI